MAMLMKGITVSRGGKGPQFFSRTLDFVVYCCGVMPNADGVMFRKVTAQNQVSVRTKWDVSR